MTSRVPFCVMRNPDKLLVVPMAEDLAVATYHLTRQFPQWERFGLMSQMQRAAVSIGSNIVEGCGQQTDRGFISYVHRSVGSVRELQFQTRIARRLEYSNPSDLADLSQMETTICKKLIRLIVALR